jgi:hypothetical protein
VSGLIVVLFHNVKIFTWLTLKIGRRNLGKYKVARYFTDKLDTNCKNYLEA